MGPSRTFAAILLSLQLTAAATLAAPPEASAGNGERIWHLAGYLNGTSADVAKSINHQVEELLQRKAELINRKNELQRELDNRRAELAQSVHANADYKAIDAKAQELKR